MDLIGTIEDDEDLSVAESDDSEQQVSRYLYICEVYTLDKAI